MIKMFLNNHLRKATSLKFKEFCRHCTLHGTYYFSESSRWWVHAVWVLILTSSLALCCYLCHMIWEKFVIDPTLTVVETTHLPTADIPFPAVTACAAPAVYGPHRDKISQLLTLRGFNRTQIVEFFESFSMLQEKDYSPKPYVRKMHSLLNSLGYPFATLLLMFKRPCEDLLVECSWRSHSHNCSKMFRSMYTMMGFCCQFDIAYFRDQVPADTNFVTGVQPHEALEITVDGRKVTEGNHSTYVSIYVFDDQDEVSFINNAFTLTPGAYFDMNVYLWTIYSSVYVKALPIEQRKCVLETDPNARSYQGCIARHIMRKVVNQCKCLPFESTAADLNVDVFNPCTWDRFICIYQNLEAAQADMKLVMSQNECFQKCDYVQYEVEVEFVKNPISDRALNSTSKVAVHFSDTTCIKYRREVLYTWDQMLELNIRVCWRLMLKLTQARMRSTTERAYPEANLGGIFGLCLGGSILSIIELIWFIFDLVFTIINGIFEKKKAAKENNNKVAAKKMNGNKILSPSENPNTRVIKSPFMRYKFTH